MAGKTHRYAVSIEWTGNTGQNTRTYRGYARSHEISAPGKPTIHGSADSSFHGDPACWNPEELLVASLSACHKLWYLALCAQAGVSVLSYRDQAEGEMRERDDGSGEFTRVVLRPHVVIEPQSDIAVAQSLHDHAHEMCFIARSINFEVSHEPKIERAG